MVKAWRAAVVDGLRRAGLMAPWSPAVGVMVKVGGGSSSGDARLSAPAHRERADERRHEDERDRQQNCNPSPRAHRNLSQLPDTMLVG